MTSIIHNRIRPAAVVLAAATGLIAAACSAGAVSTNHLAGNGNPDTAARTAGSVQSSTAQSAPTSIAIPRPQMLAAGREGSRAQIPWSIVGPGWTLAIWTASARNAAPDGSGTTLVLVDPQGGRYHLGTTPGDLTDWSGDGQRALFQSLDSHGGTVTTVVEDLRSGALDSFQLPNAGAARFTQPKGRAILDGAGFGQTPLQRFDVAGHLQFTYTAAPSNDQGFAESPDGSQIAIMGSNLVEVVSNDGRPVRSLSSPAGVTGCRLDRWWTGDSVLVGCSNQLWVYPTSGAVPYPLTAPNASGGFDDAWPVPGGIIVEASTCGISWLDRILPDGSPSPLEVPGTPGGGSVRGVGFDGNKMAVLISSGCDEGRQGPSVSNLDWYSPDTDVVTPLLGTGVNGGRVITALSFDR